MGHEFGTRAVHAGTSHDSASGAVVEPVTLSTTFRWSSADEPASKYEYSRIDNPNRDSFEQAVASLEQAKHAIAFASGSAATGMIVQALASAAHIVASKDIYGGTHQILSQVAPIHKIEVSFVENAELDVEEAITPDTRLVWIESPSNPTLRVTDIAKVAAVVADVRKKSGQELYLVVDNTFMSPYLQNPLVLGADIVMHSVTKYINGHSDVLMGITAVNDDNIATKLRFLQTSLGAVPSPFDCWLAHRGVKTLHLRMRAASANALEIAKYLESRLGRGVVAVNYTGLDSHPRRDVALKQQREGMGGGMLSFQLEGGLEQARAFCSSAELLTFAVSLGGTETLCGIPVLSSHKPVPREQREAMGVYDSMVRLSVGIEETPDLIRDISQALDKALATLPSNN